jgi:hypothetical protein
MYETGITVENASLRYPTGWKEGLIPVVDDRETGNHLVLEDMAHHLVKHSRYE